MKNSFRTCSSLNSNAAPRHHHFLFSSNKNYRPEGNFVRKMDPQTFTPTEIEKLQRLIDPDLADEWVAFIFYYDFVQLFNKNLKYFNFFPRSFDGWRPTLPLLSPIFQNGGFWWNRKLKIWGFSAIYLWILVDALS